MKTSKFDAWIKKIQATEVEEISCSECLDLLPGYVEGEVFGRHTSENHKIEQHIFQCQVCHEEYEILRDLVQMDREEDEPTAGE